MAVVAVKSTLITNADATPVVFNSPRVDGGPRTSGSSDGGDHLWR
jgi:hypothetical protein